MNKKITPKIFFSVLGGGIKNAFIWTFGYKNKSGFWRVIMALITLSLMVFVGMIFYAFGCEVMHWWGPNGRGYDTEKKLSENITYKYRYNYYEDNVGNIVDDRGRKLVKDVNWVSEKGDSIIVFAQNGYRGYFDLRTAKVIVPADKYTSAFIYSEGRALAMTKDSIFIIDNKGVVVRSFGNAGHFNSMNKCYHQGYLPMMGENCKMGLIDTDGVWVIDPEYDSIDHSEQFWIVQKEGVNADGEYRAAEPALATIFDDSLRLVLQGEWSDVTISGDDGFVVSGQDHWQRRYGYNGKLIDNFLCDRIETLSYKTGETGYRTNRFVNDGDESVYSEEYPIEAVASLKKYVTSNNWEGLMTLDGRPVTPPLYWSIEAIGKNLFLCHYDQSAKYGVLLNEKGEIVTK